MANFSLEIKQSARKELDALDDPLFSRVDRKIMTLSGNPNPPGSKKLRGHKDLWRIRIGSFRVVYLLDNAQNKSLSCE